MSNTLSFDSARPDEDAEPLDTGGLPLDVHSRAMAVYDGRRDRGDDIPTALGWAGNAVVESKANPYSQRSPTGAAGTFQWLGSRLKKYRELYGHEPEEGDLDEHLDYVDWENKNTEPSAAALIQAAAPNPMTKARAIRSFWERPGRDPAEVAEEENNAANATAKLMPGAMMMERYRALQASRKAAPLSFDDARPDDGGKLLSFDDARPGKESPPPEDDDRDAPEKPDYGPAPGFHYDAATKQMVMNPIDEDTPHSTVPPMGPSVPEMPKAAQDKLQKTLNEHAAPEAPEPEGPTGDARAAQDVAMATGAPSVTEAEARSDDRDEFGNPPKKKLGERAFQAARNAWNSSGSDDRVTSVDEFGNPLNGPPLPDVAGPPKLPVGPQDNGGAYQQPENKVELAQPGLTPRQVASGLVYRPELQTEQQAASGITNLQTPRAAQTMETVVPGQGTVGAAVNKFRQSVETSLGTAMAGVPRVVEGMDTLMNSGALRSIATIDSGKRVPPIQDPFNYQGMTPDERTQFKARIAASAAEAGSASAADNLTRSAQENAQRVAPVSSAMADSAAVKMAGTVGGFAPIVLGTLAGGLPGVAGLAALQGYESTFERARQAGASPDDSHRAALAGGLSSAALMTIPAQQYFGRFVPGLQVPILGAVLDTALASGTMVGVSQLQTLADNAIAKYNYSPSQSLLENVGNSEDMGAQALIGAAMHAAPRTVDAVGRAVRGAAQNLSDMRNTIAAARQLNNPDYASSLESFYKSFDEPDSSSPNSPGSAFKWQKDYYPQYDPAAAARITGPAGEPPTSGPAGPTPYTPPPGRPPTPGSVGTPPRAFTPEAAASAEEAEIEAEQSRAAAHPATAPMSPEEQTGIAALKNIGDGKPADAPPPTAGLPLFNATQVAPSTPEPASDIAAQIASMHDPATSKDSVFVANGNEASIPAKLPKGTLVAHDTAGTFLTTNPDKLRAFAQGPVTDELLTNLLGYSEGKASAVGSGSPVSVQGKDAKGDVVASQQASPQGVPAAQQAIAAQTPPNGSVAAVSPIVEQQERAAKIKAESSPVERAAAQTVEPTPAQAEAGNYKKGSVNIGGMDVAIETPKGGVRRGTDANGEPWETTMPAHYGYVKRGSIGADGDPLDVTLGPHADTAPEHPVYVIDQVNLDPVDYRNNSFDEHKGFLGFATKEDAVAAYDASFSDGSGPYRRGAVTEMPFDQFKDWAQNGDLTRPLSDNEEVQKNIASAERIPLKEIIAFGDQNLSPYILPDGSIISTNGDHHSVANDKEAEIAGLVRINYGDTRAGNRVLGISLPTDGSLLPDSQRLVLSRIAKAHPGTEVIISQRGGSDALIPATDLGGWLQAHHGTTSSGAPLPAPGSEGYVPVPKEPQRLIPFLQKGVKINEGTASERTAKFGLRDPGGDLEKIMGGIRARPGFINNTSGERLDDAGLRAWQAGYFTHRPDLNELRKAIENDSRGVPQYSARDRDAVEAYQYATEWNKQIARGTVQEERPYQLGSPTQEEVDYWNSLPEGAFQAGRRLPAPPQQGTDLFGGARAQPAQRTAEPTIRTDPRQQTMPGMERSAVQAQSARVAQPPRANQLPPNEGLFARPAPEQPSLPVRQEVLPPRTSRWAPDATKHTFTDLLSEAPTHGQSAAADWVFRKGRETGHEHIAVVDNKTGEIVHAGTAHLPDEVYFERNGNFGDTGQYTVHHNHPNDTALSHADNGMLANPDISHVVAHTSDGHTTITTLRPNVAENLSDAPQAIRANNAKIQSVYRAALSRAKDFLVPMVESGEIPYQTGNQLWADLANRFLQAAGLIDYKSTIQLPSSVKAAFDAKLKEQKLVPDDRHTESVRPEERTASLPAAVAEQSAQERTGSANGAGRGAGEPQGAFLAGADRLGLADDQELAQNVSTERLSAAPPLPMTGGGMNVDILKDKKGLSKALAEVRVAFSPTSLKGARPMELMLRKHGSEAALAYQRAYINLRHVRNAFDLMKKDDLIEFTDRMETGKPQPTPQLQEVADTLRSILDDWSAKIQGMGKGYLSRAIDDYMGHIWGNHREWVAGQPAPHPSQMSGPANASAQGKSPLMGSRNYLKQRRFPTQKEGIQAGLVPVTYNPIDLQLLKIRELQKGYYGEKLADNMKQTGMAIWVPKVDQPEAERRGYTKLDDRVFQPQLYGVSAIGPISPGDYYAIEPQARLFNRYMSAGIAGKSIWYDMARVAGNALNSMQLAWPGFHTSFVTMDTANSRFALGLQQIAHGQPIKGAANVAQSVVPGVAMARALVSGTRLRSALIDPSTATPEYRQLADDHIMGGGRINMDSFYNSSASGSFIHQWKDFTPKHVASEVAQMYRDTPPGWRKLVTPPLQIAFRSLDTIMHPLMGLMVPRAKLGVFAEQAKAWHDANPAATPEQRAQAMTTIWDNVEDRLGQMTYDNIFWHKALKDISHLMFRSVGWNLGTVRAGAGALVDTAQLIADSARMRRPEFTGRMAYGISQFANTAILGAMLTYLFTGRGPQSWLDYFFSPTGGETSDGSPERVATPGYTKDWIEWARDPVQTALNKVHPAVSLLNQIRTNRDYYGGIIADPERDENIPATYGDFIVNTLLPFTVTGYHKLSTEGASEAAKTLSLLGFQPAPKSIVAPEKGDAFRHRDDLKAFKRRNKEHGRFHIFTSDPEASQTPP